MDEQNLFASCFSLRNLMNASKECYKGVGWKLQPQMFMNNRLTNCRKLMIELESETYRPTPVQRFTILERGKLRKIKPVNYRDRVVQRCLCDHILIDAITDHIIYDNSACLKGRGLSFAIERVRSIVERCPNDGWILQFDFSNYFQSIDQGKMLKQLSCIIRDDKVMRLIETIISDDACGLELGSHVSQICAVLHPNPIDKALSSLNGIVGYHRYMDDGVIACRSRIDAENALNTLKSEVSKLGLSLNKNKTHFNRVTHPFVFCKMRFRKMPSGNVRVTVRKQQTRRSVNHARRVYMLSLRNQDLEIDIKPVRAALSGYVNKGDADLSRLVERAFRL